MGEKAPVLLHLHCRVDTDMKSFLSSNLVCLRLHCLMMVFKRFELMDREYGSAVSIADMSGRVGWVVEAVVFPQQLGEKGDVLGLSGLILASY
ncbi:hypothetical protein H5410_055490 [Solanum commersonii]|uniref:Uncharacterized protein n=1 Tax=Solanum commersonii TaxID=4109 RepID=A0A9J5WJI2_SOLCO|nr:hypothetical protein H5410_055490 [Solanum commersonii]